MNELLKDLDFSFVFFLIPVVIILLIIIKGSKKEPQQKIEESKKKQTNIPKEIPIKKTDQIDDPAMIRFDLEAKEIENNTTPSTPTKETPPTSKPTNPEEIEELI